jgi:hypothetical protein
MQEAEMRGVDLAFQRQLQSRCIRLTLISSGGRSSTSKPGSGGASARSPM